MNLHLAFLHRVSLVRSRKSNVGCVCVGVGGRKFKNLEDVDSRQKKALEVNIVKEKSNLHSCSSQTPVRIDSKFKKSNDAYRGEEEEETAVEMILWHFIILRIFFSKTQSELRPDAVSSVTTMTTTTTKVRPRLNSEVQSKKNYNKKKNKRDIRTRDAMSVLFDSSCLIHTAKTRDDGRHTVT